MWANWIFLSTFFRPPNPVELYFLTNRVVWRRRREIDVPTVSDGWSEDLVQYSPWKMPSLLLTHDCKNGRDRPTGCAQIGRNSMGRAQCLTTRQVRRRGSLAMRYGRPDCRHRRSKMTRGECERGGLLWYFRWLVLAPLLTTDVGI